MNGERVSYALKRVYIGLDVHRAFFVASCVCDAVVVKRMRMPPRSEAVISLIRKYFPDSEVRTCYESGYSGFWLHRELCAAGVSNIVVHAASIEVAANDRVKTDKRDSLNMAYQLAAGRGDSCAERCARTGAPAYPHAGAVNAREAPGTDTNSVAAASVWVIPRTYRARHSAQRR